MKTFLEKILFFGKGLNEQEKRRVISVLIDNCSKLLRDEGFRYDKRLQCFKRREGEFTYFFSMGITSRSVTVELKPILSIRHDTVEKIYSSLLEESQQPNLGEMTVLGQWFLETMNSKPIEWTINRYSDVDWCFQKLTEFWENRGRPFFMEHNSIVKLNDSYNQNRRVLKARLVPDWFSMLAKALIVAKLAKHPNFAELCQEYRAALGKHPVGIENPGRLLDLIAKVN
jgi:hypothetical protein